MKIIGGNKIVYNNTTFSIGDEVLLKKDIRQGCSYKIRKFIPTNHYSKSVLDCVELEITNHFMTISVKANRLIAKNKPTGNVKFVDIKVGDVLFKKHIPNIFYQEVIFFLPQNVTKVTKKYIFCGHVKYRKDSGVQVGDTQRLFFLGEKVKELIVENNSFEFEDYKKNPDSYLKSWMEKKKLKQKVSLID